MEKQVEEKLFAFEGIDGSGKTTQIEILSRRLRQLGFPVFISKAINDSGRRNKKIVNLFMETFEFQKNSISTMFLFQALHSKQYNEALGRLREGRIVLADRWNFSFWIYHQNFGPLKNDFKSLRVIDRVAFQGLTPKITFFLDLPVELAIERKKKQQIKIVDIFEKEKPELYIKARNAYLKLAQQSNNWVIIDAKKTISEVHDLIWEKLSKYF